MVFFGDGRFHFPVMPLLALFAAAAALRAAGVRPRIPPQPPCVNHHA
jgi:hypothetical protein